MKKIVFTLALIIALGTLKANPVDVNTAMKLGKSFVNANFDYSSRSNELSLAYTAFTDRNEDCFYVFNVGDDGFVIFSADDFYRPVIGYSENGAFDINNIPPALSEYLNGIVAGRSASRNTSVAAPDVVADWNSLEKTGNLVSRNGGKGSDFLVKTKWNQDSPYNYCCPADPAGPGGRVYVGCLATAMAQLMRYWCYPINGIGSHCYICGNYGEICADFENTTYDWENMPFTLANNSSEAEKMAVGTLGFHCGVTIDMGYGPDGSGGGSIPIVSAMPTYFGYCDNIQFYSRQDYELEPWCDMLKEHFDMGWPCYYGGCADGGCHAFVCDGYNDYDLYHFNLGWGGGSDGWYIMDTSPYTTVADAMFNFVPQVVYDATPSAPTDLVVTTVSDVSLNATVQWTNPTTYLNGDQLSEINRVVVMRNGKVAFEQTGNITPGQSMSFEDRVPYYDEFDYKVYVEVDGKIGKQIVHKNVHFGPTCDWRIVMTTTNFQGWNGGYISVYNMAGNEIAQVTMTTSTPMAKHIDMPLGTVKFGWTAPADTLDNIGFSIKDSENNKLYEFSGSTIDIEEGIFFVTNNGCGNENACEVPTNLTAELDGDNINVSWDAVENQGYGYLVFRDEQLCYMAVDATSFVDNDATVGGHCYSVGVLCDGGWNGMTSNVSCATVGEGCDPASNLWYEVQPNGKPTLTWAAPASTEGLSGYYVYRKTGADGTYERAKIVNANKTEYKETKAMDDGVWYYYKVVAYYQSIECAAAPAKALYGDEFFVKYLYSLDNVEENGITNVCIYPNPAKDILTVKGENITNIVIFNMLGQKALEENVSADEHLINIGGFEAGVYMVKVVADDGIVMTRRITIAR